MIEQYLVIITTVLVATQVIRIIQNTMNLRRQNKLIHAQLDELSDLSDDDLKRRMKNDKALEELLPTLLEKYKKED